MREVMVLVRNTVKLLLRNKAFLMFLVVIPIGAALLLNIKDWSDEKILGDQQQVYLMHDMTERICYDAKQSMLPVKVYDSTNSSVGMTLAEQLAEAGIFQVFYCNTADEGVKEIESSIDRTVKNDRLGAVIYLTAEFLPELNEGKMKTGIRLYNADTDERNELLEHTLQQIVGSYIGEAAQITEGTDLNQALAQAKSSRPSLKQVIISPMAEEAKLNYAQNNQLHRIGYVLAIVTISFLFSGVIIADTVIQERQYKVFHRIQLSEVTPLQYVASKYIVCLVTVLLQCGVTALALNALVSQEYAISKGQMLLVIGITGLVFNTFSLCVGILCNNVMNTNYLAFVIWAVTSMLSGCYFDLSDAGKTIQGLSNLMPQKWALDSVSRIILGQQAPYHMLFIAAAAFLLMIGTGAILGTRNSLKE